MPTLTSGDLVLVTGASGFVGTYVVEDLLAAGFNVRVAVRSPAKGQYIQSLFPDQKDRITVTIVENMDTPGAYDKAVEGVQGIVHLASVMDVTPEDPREIIEPAVKGVETVVRAALEHGTGVKRIVQMSSTVAVGSGDRAPGRYTEDDWNDASIQKCADEGKKADPNVKYQASKTSAEEAYWAFDVSCTKMDKVALVPGLIVGAQRQYGNADLGGSVGFLLPWLKPGMPESALAEQIFSIVDVHDVAAACILALTTEAAAGQRFILSAESLFGNDFALGADNAKLPGVLKGNADKAYRAKLIADSAVFDGSKATKVLGLQYRDKDTTVAEAIESVLGIQAKNNK